MQNTRARWLLFMFLGVIFVVVFVVVSRRNEPRLPSLIATLELKQSLKGSEASAMINRLHDKGVSPQSNVIGIYGGKQGNAVVYMSVYASDTEVLNALRDMRSRISTGHPIFTNYSEKEVHGHQVSSCSGQGQTHYFFSHEKQLYWLAADNQIAQEGVEDLVRNAVEDT